MHQVVVSIPFGLQETHPSGGAPADLQGMVVELAEAKEGRKKQNEWGQLFEALF